MTFKFRTFVNRHQDQVFSLALYLLRNRAEAEDVVQDTYTKLWQRIEEVEEATAKAWLMKVTRNACLDRLRAKRNEMEVSVEVDAESEDKGPSGEIAHAQLSQWLRDAINKLKEPYKSLIVLRDLQQHSYDHIATALSLNLNQVKSYIFRARKQLRDILSEAEL